MSVTEILKNYITEYGIEVDNELFKKLDIYASLLKEWNEKINLTAILDGLSTLVFK